MLLYDWGLQTVIIEKYFYLLSKLFFTSPIAHEDIPAIFKKIKSWFFLNQRYQEFIISHGTLHNENWY